jgi:hypothetical protein
MPGRSNPHPPTMAAIRRRRPWYERDGGTRFVHDDTLVREHYPGLRYRMDDYAGRAWLEGTMTLRTESGIPTTLCVRVEFPDGYPNREPRIYETAGRFPRHPDRHMLTDGLCCLWLRPETKWDPEDPDCLLRFLDEAILFFERQLIREMYPDEPWPGGERGHGLLGYAEYVSELLGDNGQRLWALTPVLTGAVRVGRNAVCPCGSGTKYKRCCLPSVEEIERRVGTAFLRDALSEKSGS